MHVLIATDTVHPQLTALATGEALAEGWRAASPWVDVSVVPLADGGPGTLEVIAGALPGRDEMVTVTDHAGTRRPARLRVVTRAEGAHENAGDAGARPRRPTIWADAAEALGTLADHGARPALDAGLLAPATAGPEAVQDDRAAHLTRLATTAHSGGAGALVRAASHAGRLVLLVGDLLAHDAGAGALAELGAARGPIGDLLRSGGLAAGGADHDEALTEVLARALLALDGLDLVVATRTDEPLFGLHGANANLSRATGVDPVAAQELERSLGALLARIDTLLPAARRIAGDQGGARTAVALGRTGEAHHRRRSGTTPGSGAGGGLAAMLEALGARIFPAADVVATEVGLEHAAEDADLFVTAVPVLDGGALAFSVPATVGAVAVRRAAPVIAVAREVRTSARELAPLGVAAAHPVTDVRRGHLPPERTPDELLSDIRARGERLARTWTPERG